jgi:hypothetical protein
MLGCSLYYLPELLFIFGTGGGLRKAREKLITLLDEASPVSQSEVGEGTTSPWWFDN